jgi:fibronectin-binding autotransporter adhesin
VVEGYRKIIEIPKATTNVEKVVSFFGPFFAAGIKNLRLESHPIMKPRILSSARLTFPLAAAIAALLAAPLASAATIYWDGATPASWDTNTNWSTASGADTPDPGAVPGALDDAIFNITTVNGAETVTLDANQAARSLTFNNTDTTTLIGGGTARTLTLGVGGMAMSASAGAVTLGDGTAGNDVLISLAAGARTWTNNHASNAFTINNTVSSFSRVTGATLTFNQASAGLFSINTTSLPNDATGIIGRWAFFGTGGTQRYAVNNAGSIEGYSGGTGAATANDFGSASTNYDLTTAAVTLSASRTANTFRSAGAGGAIDLGASGTNTLTANGILAVGSGTLTVQRTGGTGTVVIGASNELVIAGSQAVTISAPISGASKAVSYSGTSTLTLSAVNTFTGGLNINSGTVVASNSASASTATSINLSSGAALQLAGDFFNNMTLNAPLTINGSVTKPNNGALTLNSGGTLSGSGSFTTGGQCTITLNSNNAAFTGTFSENSSAGGGLILGNNGALGSGTFVFSGNNAVSSTVTNFSNTNTTALTFAGDRTFSGSNNMNLGTGSVTLSGGNRTLTVTGVTLTLGGAVGQDVAGRQLTKAGTGTLALTGSSGYSGATVISAGNLNLGGSTATGSLTSPTLTLGGGTFSYTRTGSTTQSFTTTNFNSAPANVLTVASGNTLNLGNIVRGAGVTYDFSTVLGGGTVAANLSNNSAAGIMSTYFTYGANTWAVANGPGVAISAFTGYTQTSGAGTTASNYIGANIDVDSSEGALSGGITTNSIRFNEADANSLTLTGTNVVSSGGILVGSGVGSNLSTITGGTSLTGPASGALTIWQNNTAGGLTIGANIINSGTTPLDKFGPGTLTLSGANTYTGTTTIYGGTLVVSGGAAIANAGLVTLANTAGVTFQLNSNETIGNLSGGGTTGGSVALGGNTLTVGDGTAQTYAGNFTGTSGSSIVKQGSQTLTLSNATSIPGTATINAGMLAFSSNTSVSGGTITLGANSSGLLFNGGSSAGVSGLGGVTISNNIILGNSVTTTGARLWATGNNGRRNFTGNITGAAGAAGAQTLLFDTRAGTINGGDRTSTTISGVIANGNQALNLNFAITPQTAAAAQPHPAYVNLTGLNTFTGSITATRGAAGNSSWLIIGGERWADGSNNTPAYGRMGSGRLGDNNSGVYAGNFALGGTAGNIVNLGYFSSADQTWSGTIGTGGVNNNGALVKEGTGTLTLTNANLYNSVTTIGGGTLNLGFDTTTNNILPSTTPLHMGLGTIYDPISANADMTIAGGPSGGTLQLAGAAASATQTVASLTTASNTASTILVGADRTLTISSGTVTTGANSALNFNTAAGGADASTSTVGTSIVAFGAAPTFSSGYTVTDTTGFGLAMVNGSNQVIRNISTSLLPASLAGSATDYRIDNNGGGSGDAGSSTLAISASQSAKSITVDTTGGSGVLTLNSGVILSSNIWNFGGSNNYQITGSASGAGVRPVASNDTMVINNYNTGTVTFTSPILANGANALVVNGIGTTVLNGLNTFTGATTISGGTLQIGATGRLVGGTYAGGITIGTGSLFRYSGSNAQTLSGAITGAGGLTKDTNTSDLSLTSTTNTYTGDSTVSAGRITATAVTNLSSGATRLVQSGVGQFFLNGAVNFANPINISGTGYLESGDSQNNNSGAVRMQGSTLSGPITLSGNSRIAAFGTSTNTISGQITGGFGIDFYGFQNSASAAEVFVLSNPSNDYSGATTIINSNYNTTNLAGVSTTLRLGASNVIPDGASAGNVAFAINGTNNNATTILDLNGFNETINGLTVNAGTFATRITNTAAATSASVLTVGANDTTSSFSGTLTDSGAGRTLALTKIGSGILTLSGTSNSYIGATTVSAGTLAVTGSLGATAVSVNAGTLSGNGNFGGNVSIASGATHALAVAATPGAQDTTVITGTLTLTSGNILDLTAAATPDPGEYVLATATTAIAGTPTTINYNGITGVVTVDTASNPKRLLLNVTGGADVTPPTLTSITDNVTGGPVDINAPVTYTVTFSEDMDASTVTAADFSNAGTATASIGAPSETTPGVFTVVVTPSTSGTLRLQIPISAVLTDVAGNSLDNDPALLDDTTITVRTPYATWAAGFLPGADVSNPALNFDSDGLTNLQEYAFGTDPTASSGGSIEWTPGSPVGAVTQRGTPVVIEESGMYYAVYGRRVDYATADVTYTQQFSPGLSVWGDFATAPTVIATDGTIEAVKVPFPGLFDFGSGPEKATFFRMEVSQ